MLCFESFSNPFTLPNRNLTHILTTLLNWTDELKNQGPVRFKIKSGVIAHYHILRQTMIIAGVYQQPPWLGSFYVSFFEIWFKFQNVISLNSSHRLNHSISYVYSRLLNHGIAQCYIFSNFLFSAFIGGNYEIGFRTMPAI